MKMNRLRRLITVMVGVSLLAVVALASCAKLTDREKVIPLKEAKLIIEHNATDKDTGFQGFIDSEGWHRLGETKGKPVGKALLTHTIPEGPVLLSPREDAKVPAEDLTVSWSPVTKSIT